MNKTKLPNIISVLILTLITVIMWVSLDVYRAFKKPVQSVVPPEVSQPLTPSLDQNSIKLIESRNFLDDSQIPDNIVSSSPTPKVLTISTPTPVPTVEAALQSINASGSGLTQ